MQDVRQDPQALDLWLDGALTESEAASLEQRLETDGELHLERRRLEDLHRLLVQLRVEPSPDFVDGVMSRLPQRRPASARPWVLAVVALVALGAAATGLLSWALGGSGGGVLAPLQAIADFVATVTLAGAGLLGASWRGVGQLVADWLGASAGNLVLGIVAVLGANLLLISLLRRRRLSVQQVSVQKVSGQKVKADRDRESS